MRLYYNLDIGRLVKSPVDNSQVTSLAFIRGDSTSIDLSFIQNGLIVELDSSATGIFGCKPSGKYDADYIVSALSWTKSGTGVSTIYTFNPSFNTDQLNSLLASGDGNSNNDVPSITILGEISWTVSGKITSTGGISVSVSNDVIKGNEGSPTDANPPLLQLLTPDIRSSLAVTAAGNYAISTLVANQTIVPVAVSDLASGTATLALGAADFVGLVELLISLPAAAGSVVEIHDSTATGTLLDSFTSLASATTAHFRAYWDSNAAAWKRLSSAIDTP